MTPSRLRAACVAALAAASLTAQPAFVERVGMACEKSLHFAPNGSGGYVVSQQFQPWNPNIGVSIGPLANDSVSAPQNLGFTFTMPGGTTTTQLVAEDNGRLMIPGTETTFTWPPTPFFFWNRPFPTITPFWHPINPTLGGDVFFSATPGFAASATFTWQDVVQSNLQPSQSSRLTFQCTVRIDGSIQFVYRSTESFVKNANNVMIGVTQGSLASGPGESSFNTLPINGGPTIYDFFNTSFSGGETNVYQLGLNPLTTPVMGANFDLRIDGIPTGTLAAAILFGLANPNVDLTPILGLGLPGCSLYTDAALPTTQVAFTGPFSSVQSFLVPTDLSVFGLNVYLQGATITPGLLPLGVLLSNGVHGVIGT